MELEWKEKVSLGNVQRVWGQIRKEYKALERCQEDCCWQYIPHPDSIVDQSGINNLDHESCPGDMGAGYLKQLLSI